AATPADRSEPPPRFWYQSASSPLTYGTACNYAPSRIRREWRGVFHNLARSSRSGRPRPSLASDRALVSSKRGAVTAWGHPDDAPEAGGEVALAAEADGVGDLGERDAGGDQPLGVADADALKVDV